MRDARERLQDILDAIDHIQRYAARGREAFEADELLQNWFVRHLQIIGEAARLLPEEIRATAPDIPWSEIIGMRHILVHNYFGIDTQVVWMPLNGTCRVSRKRSGLCANSSADEPAGQNRDLAAMIV